MDLLRLTDSCEVINEDARALCKTCSNFTTKTPESPFLSKFGISIGNFEEILDIALLLLLLTLDIVTTN